MVNAWVAFEYIYSSDNTRRCWDAKIIKDEQSNVKSKKNRIKEVIHAFGMHVSYYLDY
jgi:hypothetical protein